MLSQGRARRLVVICSTTVVVLLGWSYWSPVSGWLFPERDVVSFAAVSTLIADSLTAVAVVTAAVLAIRYWQREAATSALARSRRRELNRPLATCATSKMQFFRKRGSLFYERADAVLLDPGSPGSEIEWLLKAADALGARRNPRNDQGLPRRSFLLDSTASDGWFNQQTLQLLSEKYLRYSKRLEALAVFGRQNGPGLQREADTSRRTASILMLHARVNSERVASGPAEDQCAGFVMAGAEFEANAVSGASTMMRAFPLSISERGKSAPYHPVDCLYTPVPDVKGEGADVQPRSEDLEAHEYDGLLPLVHGVRLERDLASGRDRVHFACSSRRWRHFRDRNDYLTELRADPFSSPDGILTLGLAAVDVDSRLVLSRRSRNTSSNRGAVNTLVTGNVELASRFGVSRDEIDGTPDLKTAMVREAAEEVGVTISRDQAHLIGLQRLWATNDRGSWLATFGTNLPISTREIAEQMRFGDPIEGSWEIGEALYALTVPDTPRRLGDLLASLLRPVDPKESVTLHAVAAVVSIAAVRGTSLGLLAELARKGTPQDLDKFWTTVPCRHPFAARTTRTGKADEADYQWFRKLASFTR